MAMLGAFGYGAVAALYALLTLLLLIGWRSSRIGATLIAACAISATWAGLTSFASFSEIVPRTVLFGIEVLRTGSWLAFLSLLLGRLGASRPLLLLANLAWVGLLVTGAMLWILRQFVPQPINLGSLLIPGGLGLALIGLTLIEQLVRNWPSGARWHIKPLALGVGGMFAYDLFMYAQGVLFGVVEASIWNARGVVNLLFVPLVAIAARRNSNWDLDIFVSRQVVFYSTTLVAVGLYLIVMSAGGYLLLLYGGTWGALAQTVFFAGAILVLVSLLFSSVLRARFKVFLSKHFFRNKYDYREEWLRLIQTLSDARSTTIRSTAIKALAQIVESPAGVLWIYDEKDEVYRRSDVYQSSSTLPDIATDDPLVEFVSDLGWLVDLEEFRRNPDRYGNLALPPWLATNDRAWLLVPLMLRNELVGLVLLEKSPTPFTLNYEDRDLLKTAGHHIAVQLAQERSDLLLAEAQQFQAYNRLTAFLMHDLNNLIAQQSLIVRNAEKHKSNPEFVDDAMQTIANSVTRMKQVMEQLRTGKAEHAKKKTLVKFLVSSAIDRCSGKRPVPVFRNENSQVATAVDTERFTMVLAHLIQNAQDATPEDGTVEVVLGGDEQSVRITIRDTGCGMSDDFVRNRLFRPFDSTKGSQGMGIGAYQAREFSRSVGGDLRVDSSIGEGTTLTLTLPVSD